MKVTIQFKDPDYSTYPEKISPKIKEAITKKFLEWDEYLQIEVDTETMTAKVVEV